MRPLKLYISYFIIFFINFLFSIKYISRYTDFGLIIGLLIFGFQGVIIFWLDNKYLSRQFFRSSAYILAFCFLLFIYLTHHYIDVNVLNVDRWSVITSFFSELFKGNYPYLAKSHMGNYPGPMPFYFAVAFPFYMIGELNLLSGLGYFVFLIILLKQKYYNPQYLRILFYLGTSVYLYWEIAVRSNIFTYSLFVLLTLTLYNHINKNIFNKYFFLSAVLTGLLLSTRSIFLLAYVIIFASSFIKSEIKMRNLISYTLISILAFGFTILPFILFYKGQFLMMNPFIVQSSFLLPEGFAIIFILISIVLSFCTNNFYDAVFYSGVSLFIAISIYFIYYLVRLGYTNAFLGSFVDISYFIFCVPFFLFYLLKSHVKSIDK